MLGSVSAANEQSMPTYGSLAKGPASYTPASTNGIYQSSYDTPQQAPQQSLGQNVQELGLQALYQNMMGQMAQFQQAPAPQQQMPAYRSQALNYRPDMQAIQANLKNVAPSVQEQQRIAAEEAARLKAEQDAWDAAHPQPTDNGYYGGGG
jgi:hypothetical protein